MFFKSFIIILTLLSFNSFAMDDFKNPARTVCPCFGTRLYMDILTSSSVAEDWKKFQAIQPTYKDLGFSN